MKKMIAMVSAMAMLSMGALTFTGCSEEETPAPTPTTVMNVSLNPEVEFVLDANNLVISVNALNEEGNLIVSSDVFTNILGKDAEIAVKSFVQVSQDMGFLIEQSATVGPEEVKISVSGDMENANELYTNIEATVNAYIVEANLSATVSMTDALTEVELKALVAECAPYMEQAEIQALSYMQLVETIYESRKETADFYSQELKNAYYEAKANVMNAAEIDALQTKLSFLFNAAVEGLQVVYNEAVDALEAARVTHFVSETSGYQQALQALRVKKVEYLEYRAQVAKMDTTDAAAVERAVQTLENKESLLNAAEEALTAAASTAEGLLVDLQAALTSAYNTVIAEIQKADVQISAHLSLISKKQQSAKATFFNEFESNYATAITTAKTNWANMKAELEAKTSVEAQPQA